jgi:hypothetical protein
MRGLPNVSFILLDEADFFPPGQQQQDARDVSERYIAKSNPYIVLISTPNAPDGLIPLDHGQFLGLYNNCKEFDEDYFHKFLKVFSSHQHRI